MPRSGDTVLSARRITLHNARTGSGQFSCVAESEGGVRTQENATILITESVTYLDKVPQSIPPPALLLKYNIQWPFFPTFLSV